MPRNLHGEIRSSFLQFAKQNKWMVLILQSKRRASKTEQGRVQEIKTELNKVLGVEKENGKRDALEGLEMAYLFVLINDSENVEAYGPIEHFCVIKRDQHKEFYGEYRQQLRYLRDLSKAEPMELAFGTIDPETFDFSSLTVEQLTANLKKLGESGFSKV
jgi:hypothetical protein